MRRWTRSRRGPSPIPTRSGWSATTGCGRRSWHPIPAIGQEIRETVAAIKNFADQVHCGNNQAPEGRQVHAGAVDRHRRLGAGADVRRRRAGTSRHGQDAASLHRQHRPRRHRPRAGPAGRDGLDRDPGRGHEQERNHAGDPERNARRGRGLSHGRGSTSPTTPWPSPGSGRSWTSRPQTEGWLARFPMWDWVGGRTSELSAVGLVPGLLQGLDMDGMLAGAAAMDVATRQHDTAKNPAALLALMWHLATGGKGEKDMVVLPYKDRLLLFSPLSPATGHGVAGQAARSRRQAGRPGDQRLRQQGIDRSACVRPAASRRREQLLRHLHPGARGWWHSLRGRARRHLGRLSSTVSCWEPARPSSPTTGNR